MSYTNGATTMPRKLQTFEWWYRGRCVVIVEFRDAGPPSVTVKVGKDRVDGASRERAAFWLGEYLPRLSHDERYLLLWQ